MRGDGRYLGRVVRESPYGSDIWARPGVKSKTGKSCPGVGTARPEAEVKDGEELSRCGNGECTGPRQKPAW